ncbi:MAG: CRISPR-associated endonuclease Cas1 [Armatimonadota bacterium]|nr:CRISPR-associated endonuclease Cas1 [Armatimonadota bacterium]MDR7528722.1 CRISPR-associated endonuclease Cas1 [Armatimonadota bacterium]
MATLAFMEQGMTLSTVGEMFVAERNGTVIQRVRMVDVDEVLIFGAVTLTPAAIAALLHRGIDTVFLTARGRYRGRLVGKPGRNVELRVAQFQRLGREDVALALGRAIVAGKVANQRYLLLRAQREQRRGDLAEAIAALRRIRDAVDTVPSLEVLRGLEGQASAVYFGVFGRCIRNPQFGFERRTRRPPTDPVNAMLSFGYTLLAMAVEAAVLRVGLDPMLGAFHTPEYGRPSLVLDLIEEFRPVMVDALVLRLVNRREVTPEDFEQPPEEVEETWAEEEGPDGAPPPPRAVWLGATGRRIFFRAWGRRLHETHYYERRRQTLTMEEILQQQVYHLAQVLRGEEALYRAFVVR